MSSGIGCNIHVDLAIYALMTKNMKLALFTLLGWIVFGFGPVFKAYYFFDNQQQVAKTLSTSDFKYIPQYTNYDKMKLQNINGENYLIKTNKKGENIAYAPILRNGKELGIIDPKNGTFQKKF